MYYFLCDIIALQVVTYYLDKSNITRIGIHKYLIWINTIL